MTKRRDIRFRTALARNKKVLSAVRLEVTDITALTGAQLDSLYVGDVVIKVTGKKKYPFRVSYKGEGVGEGLCLTYVAAGLIKTVSYDLTSDGWVYNSTAECTINVDE